MGTKGHDLESSKSIALTYIVKHWIINYYLSVLWVQNLVTRVLMKN